MEKSLLILGAGGFGRLIAEYAREMGFCKIAFLDDASAAADVIGKMTEYERFSDAFTHAVAAVGNNSLRAEYAGKLTRAGFCTEPFVFRPAWVSPSAKLGNGCFLLPGCVVNRNAVIGEAALINCGAIIDHDAIVEEGAHICLNAVVKAGTKAAKFYKLEAGCVIQNS